jgi:TPR repeat protein
MRRLLALCLLAVLGHAATAHAQREEPANQRPDTLIEVNTPIQAHRWFFEDIIRRAKNGSPTSMHTLAIMYYDGQGVDQSLPDTLYWLEKAATSGYGPSMTALGNLYRWDDRLKDEEQALDWYLKGAQKGEHLSMRAAGDIFSKGIEGKLPPNPTAALQWYSNADRAKKRAERRAVRQMGIR